MKFLCSLLFFTGLFFCTKAQTDSLLTFAQDGRFEALKQSLTENQKTATVVDLLSSWKDYQTLVNQPRSQTYRYTDSLFGNIRVQVTLPENYDPRRAYPLILLLHGAVGHASEEGSDDDIFFQFLKNKQVILVRPRAEAKRNFNWVVNEAKSGANPTFETLYQILLKVKNQAHVDDSRIFVFGHSDGADGSLMLLLNKPGVFAAGVLYNSMLTNIFERGVYLENLRGQPLYLVHSDQDDLRPIQQIDTIVSLLKTSGIGLEYKRYVGFKHYDKHLEKDLPAAWEFILKTNRKSFSKDLLFEQNGLKYAWREWIKVDEVDPSQFSSATDPFAIPAYNKREKIFTDRTYYTLDPFYSIKGHYQDNVFTLRSNGVKAMHVLLQNGMVDLSKPIKIIWNDQTVYEGLVKGDQKVILQEFSITGDSQRIYLGQIPLRH